MGGTRPLLKHAGKFGKLLDRYRFPARFADIASCAGRGQKLESRLTNSPIVRVSILRTDADRFSRVRDEMAAALEILAPGIRALTGHIDFFAGADEATCSLTNVSLWRTLADAQQLDHFRPMLDLAPRFVALGATFQRPIINAATLWRTAP